jgi:hypothetical protein
MTSTGEVALSDVFGAVDYVTLTRESLRGSPTSEHAACSSALAQSHFGTESRQPRVAPRS